MPKTAPKDREECRRRADQGCNQERPSFAREDVKDLRCYPMIRQATKTEDGNQPWLNEVIFPTSIGQG